MSSRRPSAVRRALDAVRLALPRGRTLPEDVWDSRHRAILVVLWAHIAGLCVFALARGYSPAQTVRFAVPLAMAALVATTGSGSRRARSATVALGLLTAAAVLVHVWNGRIEAHFDFFVMIAVMALYEDWLPFGLAVAFVVLEHGVVGVVAPHAVYDHGGNPWMWAGVHGAFALAAACASIVTWRLNEDMRARSAQADADARETAERFRTAFESGLTGMALVSPQGEFLSVNNALCEMIGYSAEEVVGRRFADFTHPSDLAASLEQSAALRAGRIDRHDAEKRYVHRQGHDVWVRLGVTAIRSEDGALRYTISQMHDVTEQRRIAEELTHQALHDPLTGLANRALLVDRLRQALVALRRRPGALAVITVDVDRFKRVNDGLGQAGADAILLDIAKRLSEVVRAQDTIARFGGDEFSILCDDAGPDEIRALAQRVLAALEPPFIRDGHELHLTASAGVRIVDGPTVGADEVLRDAETALAIAKARGRARFEVFDAGAASSPADLRIEEELRLALEREELTVHYQPCIELATGRVATLEALVRWQHPERGMVSPGEFIPAAEDSGLIVPLGAWVLREACSQMAEWRRTGAVDERARISVNVSAQQLSRPELPRTVAAALSASGLDPDGLCLEITESAIIADPAIALANVVALKEQGIVIALDDFGVGFNSLSQIRDFPPVDVIKVDRSFTAGLTTNDSDAAVVGAVLGLAGSLGLQAVAEGVETVEQLERLRELGCDIGQGFFFARPQPPETVTPLAALDHTVAGD